MPWKFDAWCEMILINNYCFGFKFLRNTFFHACIYIKLALSYRTVLSKSNFDLTLAPPLVFDEAYSCPWPQNHKFPMNKFHMLKETLVMSRIYQGSFIKPPHPFENTNEMNFIYSVHERGYVDRFLSNTLSSAEKRKIGLVFNDHLVHRTLSELGGTIHTSDLALEYGMAVNLAGGTHHAHYNFGSGFTILNDIAVAARRAVQLKGLKSVLIFDLDVHQGDGTASIFEDDDSVFTVSVHCEDNFPFVKKKSDIDIGLPAGVTDFTYMEAVRRSFYEAIESCNPELVIYDAGVDVSFDDSLGKLNITHKGIYERDHWIFSQCLKLGIPVCGVIGGGYDKNPYALAARHSLLHRAGINVWKTKPALFSLMN